jgi:hypothetical protein
MEVFIDTMQDSGIEGSPRRREKNMMTTCSSNQIYLCLSHYISCSMHGLEFTSDGCKDCSSHGVIEEEAYVEKSQGFEVHQKETHVFRWKKTLYGFKKLGAEPLMYNKSVVKISYDRGSILKWFFKSPG